MPFNISKFGSIIAILICSIYGLNAQTITYSENYTGGTTYCPGNPQYDNWGAFRALLDTSIYVFTKVTIKGTLDTAGRVCTDTNMVNQMATALRNGVGNTWTCGGNSWAVGTPCITGCAISGDDIEFNASGGSCGCTNPGYILRPCIGNANWGGINGPTCGGATQVMTVIFEYEACSLFTSVR